MGKKKHSHYLSSICLAETWIPFFFSSTLVMTFSRIILWFCRASSRCLNLWKKGKFSGHVFPRSWVNRWEQGRFLWGQWARVKPLVSQTTELSLLRLLNSDQPAASAGKDGWEVLNPAKLQQHWGTCAPCALPGGSCGRWGCRRSHKTPSAAPGGAPDTTRTPLLHLQLLRNAKQGCHWQAGELRKRVTKLTTSWKVSMRFFFFFF